MPIEKLILEASIGRIPEEGYRDDHIDNALSSNRTGADILTSLSFLSNGQKADPTDLQIGLASLVRLGLIEDFRNIAKEILLLDYFAEKYL